jgi:primosomal replication protein N
VDVNRIELTARLIASDGLRHTPSGMPVLQWRLAHGSEQLEAGHSRQVECELDAVLFGPLAVQAATLAAGSGLNCQGFLDRKGARNPQLVLHVTRFESLQE